MKVHYDNGRNGPDGFIYVASRTPLYYELGCFSAQSMRDCHPDANLTLYTHEKFLDPRAEQLFDKVIIDIPIHIRTKMWAMARTPYQRTIYIDCDSCIRHKDIRRMHDLMNDCDMFFCGTLAYTVANFKWAYMDIARKHEPKYHGSLCGYWNTPLNLEFMQVWFDSYIKQRTTKWPFGDNHYKEWQQFDMFTLWRMTNKFDEEFKQFHNLNIDLIPRRWNTTPQDFEQELEGKPVITQLDRGFWRRLPDWPAIEKRFTDEKRQVKLTSPTDPVIEYN